jgi:hypothetical protein
MHTKAAIEEVSAVIAPAIEIWKSLIASQMHNAIGFLRDILHSDFFRPIIEMRHKE